MKTKTALLAMGLFTLAGAVTVSCGGSSDEDESNSTAGTSSNTSGASSTAGTTGNGGTSSTAGTNNNTAGTNNNTAGTNNNNNGGAVDPGTGGAPDQGTAGAPDQGAGGAGPNGCPAAMPTDGSMCMQGDSPFQGCTYDMTNCRCRRNGQMREWQCDDLAGAGGAGNFGNAVCPDNAMDGDPCTGQGLCAGQQCFCNNDETTCF